MHKSINSLYICTQQRVGFTIVYWTNKNSTINVEMYNFKVDFSCSRPIAFVLMQDFLATSNTAEMSPNRSSLPDHRINYKYNDSPSLPCQYWPLSLLGHLALLLTAILAIYDIKPFWYTWMVCSRTIYLPFSSISLRAFSGSLYALQVLKSEAVVNTLDLT